MILPREAFQEDPEDTGSQDLPTGNNPQAVPSVVAEDPVSEQGTYVIPETPIPSAG